MFFFTQWRQLIPDLFWKIVESIIKSRFCSHVDALFLKKKNLSRKNQIYSKTFNILFVHSDYLIQLLNPSTAFDVEIK